jgi:hypothetical protein
MKGWLFPYGIWYALAAWAAFDAVTAAAEGDVFNTASNGLIAAVIGVIAIRSRVRWSRSGEKALRAEMIRLIDERAGSGASAWLHRDAHLLFGASRRRVAGMRERTLLAIDEDQLRDIEDAQDAGGGKVAVTAVSYRAHPAFPRVMCRMDGGTALVTAADIEQADDPDERERWWQGYAGLVRAIRAGHAFAGAGELAGVVAQFRDAEPVSPDGPEEREPAS